MPTTDELGGVSAATVVVGDSGDTFVVVARVLVPDGANRLQARLLRSDGQVSNAVQASVPLPLLAHSVAEACVAAGDIDTCVVGAQCLANVCVAVDGDGPAILDVDVSASDAADSSCAALEASYQVVVTGAASADLAVANVGAFGDAANEWTQKQVMAWAWPEIALVGDAKHHYNSGAI